MKNELKRIIGIFLALLLAASLMPAQKGFATGKSKEDGQQSSGQADLPARYDPRELGLVTPVKSQGDYGTCGTFALAAVMEHNAMLRGYGEYDLSEYQLAWALLHPLELEGDLAAGEGAGERNDGGAAENAWRGALREQTRCHRLAMDGEPTKAQILDHYHALPECERSKDWVHFNRMLKLIRKFYGLRIYRL